MDDRLRHTADEIAAGRDGIRAVRARLGEFRAVPHPRPTGAMTRETVVLPHLEAELAWGAERDRLETRVRALETEVMQLRGALAAILREAAGAVSPPVEHHNDGR